VRTPAANEELRLSFFLRCPANVAAQAGHIAVGPNASKLDSKWEVFGEWFYAEVRGQALRVELLPPRRAGIGTVEALERRPRNSEVLFLWKLCSGRVGDQTINALRGLGGPVLKSRQ